MEAAQRLYEPEEYLALERAAEHKSELFDGRIVAMAGGTLAHAQIAANALVRLGIQLESTPCRALGSDAKVKLATRRSFYYPDVTVICGDVQLLDKHRDTLLNPSVVIEVLSPSTEMVDRIVKWGEYQLVPSLQHYLLIAQDEVCVDVYTRHGEQWLYTRYTEPEAVVELSAIDCRLRVGDLYHKVELAPEEPEEAEQG
ncbi:MAG: Uma2 family endonuclease [Armatimonadetes bacterium]|nr:Uma2 family endonuclease [Armatimonadota bacterium]